MFAALAHEDINIKMVTTGDIKISVLVDKNDGVRALKAVHQAFGLDKPHPGAGRPPTVQSPPNPAEAQFPVRPHRLGQDLTPEMMATIAAKLQGMEDILVSGIHLNEAQSRITVFDLPDDPGNASKLFSAIAADGIFVDTIVQNSSSPGKAELSYTVQTDDLERAVERTRGVVARLDSACRVSGDSDIAVLFVHGIGMRTHTGVGRTMFGALAECDINIRMINTQRSLHGRRHRSCSSRNRLASAAQSVQTLRLIHRNCCKDCPMSNPVDALREQLKNRQAKVGIIGLGYVGLPLARAFATQGVTVLGFDVRYAEGADAQRRTLVHQADSRQCDCGDAEESLPSDR